MNDDFPHVPKQLEVELMNIPSAQDLPKLEQAQKNAESLRDLKELFNYMVNEIHKNKKLLSRPSGTAVMFNERTKDYIWHWSKTWDYHEEYLCRLFGARGYEFLTVDGFDAVLIRVKRSEDEV